MIRPDQTQVADRALIGLPLAAVLWCLVSSLSGAWAAGDTLHPQDGAHAEIRIELLEGTLRFDVVMNLVFLNHAAPSVREDPALIAPEEEEAVREALEAFFRDENRVTIDGREIAPEFVQFQVDRPGDHLLPLFPVTGRLGLTRARIVVEYPAGPAPKSIGFVWGSYPPDLLQAALQFEGVQTVEGGAGVTLNETGVEHARAIMLGKSDVEAPPAQIEAQLVAEGRVVILQFTQDEPEQIWHGDGRAPGDRFMPVPEPRGLDIAEAPAASLVIGGVALLGALVSLAARKFVVAAVVGVVGAGAGIGAQDVWRVEASWWPGGARGLSEAEAKDIFTPLHANIYESFGQGSEGAIYDALARSVSGDLLDSLYNQVFQSLILEEEGGAVARVQDVELLGSTFGSVGQITTGGTAAMGFDIEARWRVRGVVYHWGHSHTRLNEYAARYAVAQTDEGWRIVASEVTEQFRVPLPGQDGRTGGGVLNSLQGEL